MSLSKKLSAFKVKFCIIRSYTDTDTDNSKKGSA